MTQLLAVVSVKIEGWGVGATGQETNTAPAILSICEANGMRQEGIRVSSDA